MIKPFFLQLLTSCFLLSALSLTSCQQKKEEQKMSAIFEEEETDKEDDSEDIDLENLEENGEIIAVTLSGPETYFEFRGQGFGLQYDLAADFARKQGLRIRMEVAHDTIEMIRMLQKGDADVIAFPLPPTKGFELTAVQDTSKTTNGGKSLAEPLGWLTRTTSPDLSEALNKWYNPKLKKQLIEARERLLAKVYTVSYHPRPRAKNAAMGIISNYDNLFRRYAVVCQWDWRLLAAQCYQESGFDPRAVSWAGAQGLMQIMPSTAAHLGVEGDTFQPETNIHAAVGYIKELNNKLSDISNPDERINFILASYNGGLGHVRDAMALTRKYGGNPQRWNEVRHYILLLSDAHYYRDPIVKFGYLRGTETAGYVSSIRSHYSYYRSISK